MPELMAHVETLSDQLHCAECNYTGEKPQNLAKHLALVPERRHQVQLIHT